MKKTILTLAVLLSASFGAHAHDEGHGPKLSDSGKYGGLVAPVISKSESNKGDKAKLIHKAELARSADGTVRVYLYDTTMKPLADLKNFDAAASATVGSKAKGKWYKSDFALEKKDNVFIGKMPKPKSKPYSIEVTLKESGKELLTAFDNLD